MDHLKPGAEGWLFGESLGFAPCSCLFPKVPVPQETLPVSPCHPVGAELPPPLFQNWVPAPGLGMWMNLQQPAIEKHIKHFSTQTLSRARVELAGAVGELPPQPLPHGLFPVLLAPLGRTLEVNGTRS